MRCRCAILIVLLNATVTPERRGKVTEGLPNARRIDGLATYVPNVTISLYQSLG